MSLDILDVIVGKIEKLTRVTDKLNERISELTHRLDAMEKEAEEAKYNAWEEYMGEDL